MLHSFYAWFIFNPDFVIPVWGIGISVAIIGAFFLVDAGWWESKIIYILKVLCMVTAIGGFASLLLIAFYELFILRLGR